MDEPTGANLDGVNAVQKYPDGTVVRVFSMRTSRDAYPSGWAYKLHYGLTEPNPPETLSDGTIRRYDNSHEDTKGHELHAAPDPEPTMIELPGMVELWERFWSEIPKSAIGREGRSRTKGASDAEGTSGSEGASDAEGTSDPRGDHT